MYITKSIARKDQTLHTTSKIWKVWRRAVTVRKPEGEEIVGEGKGHQFGDMVQITLDRKPFYRAAIYLGRKDKDTVYVVYALRKDPKKQPGDEGNSIPELKFDCVSNGDFTCCVMKDPYPDHEIMRAAVKQFAEQIVEKTRHAIKDKLEIPEVAFEDVY